MINTPRWLHKFGRHLSKCGPELLIGTAICGLFSTVYFAVKATPKAMTLIEKRKNELNEETLDIPEKIKTAWKCYVPAAVTGGITITCMVLSNSIQHKRNASLAAMYALSETMMQEYKNKVIETIGEERERAVKDSVATKIIEKEPSCDKEIYISSGGSTLCYDPLSGRYFNSTPEKLRSAENELNSRMLQDGNAYLNDFYDEIGLRNTNVGDYLCWDYNRNGFMHLYFSSTLNEKNEPCLVLEYVPAPKYRS